MLYCRHIFKGYAGYEAFSLFLLSRIFNHRFVCALYGAKPKPSG